MVGPISASGNTTKRWDIAKLADDAIEAAGSGRRAPSSPLQELAQLFADVDQEVVSDGVP